MLIRNGRTRREEFLILLFTHDYNQPFLLSVIIMSDKRRIIHSYKFKYLRN